MQDENSIYSQEPSKNFETSLQREIECTHIPGKRQPKTSMNLEDAFSFQDSAEYGEQEMD